MGGEFESHARSERPRRSRANLLLVVAGLSFAAWKLLQLSTGGAADALRSEDMAFVERPYLMYTLKPSFTRRDEPLRTSNSLGLRGAEVQLPKPDGRIRIVCLGGSTTYGFQVADDETWPAVAGRLLTELRPDLDVEVINAGVESYTTAESLANLAFRLLELEPDVVLVHHAANDVRPRRYPGFDPGYAHYRKVWDGSVEDYKPLGGEMNGINALIQVPPPEPQGDLLDNLQASGSATFRRNLISLVGLTRVHGKRPVLTTLPFDAVQSEPALAAGTRQHNDIIRALAVEMDVPLIDVDLDFAGAGHFIDAVHLDATGSAEKGRRVAEGLAQLLP